jgi:hypothetical protein
MAAMEENVRGEKLDAAPTGLFTRISNQHGD